MAEIVNMPKLGLTMTSGKITRWVKKLGDRVAAGESIVEIETDKISSEVEAPIDGYLLQILAEEGDEINITAPICIVGEKDEAIAEVSSSVAASASLPATEVQDLTAAPAASEASAAGARIFITPIAKILTREYGIDPAELKGSGPNGRIVKKDVLAARESQIKQLNQREALQQAPVQQAPVQPIQMQPGDRKVPLAGVRKIIAKRLTQSKHDIPHTYFKISIEADSIISIKKMVSDAIKAKTGRKVSLNDLIIKAVASALESFPDINASLVGDEIIYHGDINIGMAVNSDKGLIVPVIRNAAGKSLSELCRSTAAMIEKAGKGELSYEDISGGTFTVSNLGAFHIDEFTAIINPPESAILAVGRATETPCARNGEIVIRNIMNLTLSVDHRIIDGALAAQFLKKLKDTLEDPYFLMI
jgi:pyruvate dehydrogenase E2 component (dihydrolipoamide acetyltransferase)